MTAEPIGFTQTPVVVTRYQTAYKIAQTWFPTDHDEADLKLLGCERRLYVTHIAGGSFLMWELFDRQRPVGKRLRAAKRDALQNAGTGIVRELKGLPVDHAPGVCAPCLAAYEAGQRDDLPL